jgi:hypothetical protein
MKTTPVCRLLLTLLLLSMVWVPPRAAAAKREVVIYQYDGVAEGVTKAKFGMFRGILKNKLTQMSREFPAEFQELENVKQLYPNYQARTTSMSPEGIQLWLKNQTSVLCLLTGTILSEDGQNYLVVSNFYLGELKEYLPYDPIIIPLPIKISEFSNIRDSHSLVIFYALAMDAKRQGFDKHLIARFLARAKNNLADIAGRSDRLSADLGLLKTAIESAEQELLEAE